MLSEADLSVLVVLTVVLIAFIVSLYFDLRFQRIPNLLCLSVFFIGIGIQFYFNQFSGVLNGLLGSGLAILILFPLFYFKALGGGDVKLMIAVGMLLGPTQLVWSVAFATICGALTSLLLSIKNAGINGIKETIKRYYQCFYLQQYFKPSAGEAAALRVPYAPALALGWIWACSVNDDVLWAISNFRYTFIS